jgi:hypothetical protein
VISSVAAEIEAIRAGKWDSEIEKSIAVDKTTPDKPAPSPQSEVCLSIRLTLWKLSRPHLQRVSAIEGPGSDLTGVSDSSSSAPQVQVACYVVALHLTNENC